MAKIRVTIRQKIMLGCLLLSSGILVFAYFFTSYAAERAENPSAQAREALTHYSRFEQGMAQGEMAIAQQFAADADLREALAQSDTAPPASATASAPTGSPSNTAVQNYVDDAKQTLTGDYGLKPDLFVVEDGDGDVWNGGATQQMDHDDAIYSRFLAQLRVSAVPLTYLFPDRGGYIAVGVPILGPGGRGIIGGVAIGIDATRWFSDFAQSSAEDPSQRMQLVLIGPDGAVAASSLPRDKDQEIASALSPENILTELSGGQRINETTIDGQRYIVSFDRPEFFGSPGTYAPTRYLLRPPDVVNSRIAYIEAFSIATLAAIFVSFLLGAIVTRPIERFIAATQDILAGEGDLSRRVQVSSRDEMGVLAENLNRLFDNLQRLAAEVQSASYQVGASSTEISAASKQMLEGAKDQAVKIEGSTAAVTELSSSIQQVAQNAMQATKVAEESNQQVGSAIEKMSQIRSIVEDAAEKIHELGESGKRIGNIVEVIRQISEQTSLLALNASIEAAHAGEQGRGFAVVADEVSSLARRVGQSAKDIEDLIGTIKEQTSDAVRTMQDGTKEVEGGTSLVNTTLGNIKEIISMVQDTAGAVQEQAIASDEIARNMDAVQKIAHEVLTASEDAVIQGEQLRELAHALEDSVRGFRTGASAPGERSDQGPGDRVGDKPALPPRPERTAERSLPSALDGASPSRAARAEASDTPTPRTARSRS
jgi:methyl-accepting chemotaxis protein